MKKTTLPSHDKRYATRVKVLKQLSWVWNMEKGDLRNKFPAYTVLEEGISDKDFVSSQAWKK